MTPHLRLLFAATLALLAARAPLPAQPQLEPLGRGIVAIHQPDGRLAISWRLLGTDPDGMAFNLYRKADASPGGRGGRGGGRGEPTAPRKLNDTPLAGPTFYHDDSANLATRTSYFVRPVVNGIEQQPSAAFTLAAGAPPLPYLSIPL